MAVYELNKLERRYFGLKPISDLWERKFFNPDFSVYFENDKIMKVIAWNGGYAYREYDAKIDTIDREIILPKTSRGKRQKLTVSRIKKIKCSGIEFTASFEGGGIQVSNNNICIIRSYLEEGHISNYDDIRKWVSKFIAESPDNYFEWLNAQLSKKRANYKPKTGDIIAFPVGRNEFGFAQIILSNYLTEHLIPGEKEIFKRNIFMNPLLILIYKKVYNSSNIDLDELTKLPTLDPIQISDTDVCSGEFAIVGSRNLLVNIAEDIELFKLAKYFTIPLSKTDILSGNIKW